MSIHIVLFLLTKIILMPCHLHFAHSDWKLFPRKLFWKIIPRSNLHIGIISDHRIHVSYAPMPSMERMVLVCSCSVAVVSAWMTAPMPARVDKANWWGLHAVWMWLANICARQHETTRRNTSPMTSPRTPPLGFWRATVRPKPMALAGTWAPGQVFDRHRRTSLWWFRHPERCGVCLRWGRRGLGLLPFGITVTQWATCGLGFATAVLGQTMWSLPGWACMGAMAVLLGLGAVPKWFGWQVPGV